MPTAYQQPVDVKPPDLVLGATTETTTLPKFRASQCVHGPSGKRAAVFVSQTGLVVDKENIRFENIDFIWRDAKVADGAKPPAPALVRLLAGRAEFRGCSFQSEATGRSVVPAIRWEHPRRGAEAETSLPSGRLLLSDCLLRGVGVGLDCHTVGALGIELKNTLHLNGGPLLRLDHCPRADEAVSIVLTQVTLRGSGPLVECLVPHIENQPGEITVHSLACAFSPEPGAPLVRLTGAEVPERLLNSLRWTGQGSLVAPQVPMVVWRGPDGRERAADESTLSIAGLVRSEVGFAGNSADDPSASRLVHWQAPLQTADAPGIDPASLPSTIQEKKKTGEH